MMVNFDTLDFLIGVALLAILLPIVWWRKRNLSYLLFFSLFWVYLLAVVSVVIFPFVIATADQAAHFTLSINLIPFYFGSCFTFMPALCAAGLVDNILFTIPGGFGINFLTRVGPGKIIWLALATGLGFELAQLFISLLFKSSFRAIDINDAIFNASGVLLGYALYRAFAWAYAGAVNRFGFKPKGLAADIYDIVIQAHVAGKSIKAD